MTTRFHSTFLIASAFAAIVAFAVAPRAQTGEPADPQQAALQRAATPREITPRMRAAEMAREMRMTPDELAWEKILQANLGNDLPRYYDAKDAGREQAWDYVKDNSALPRMLIIGDSISRGYTLAVRHDLAGKVNVHRAPANCGATAKGLKDLNIWLGKGNWNVITWNFGIHDFLDDPPVYKRNLEILLRRLQSTGAKVIWVRTTPAPSSNISLKPYTEAECDWLNRIADEVMKAHNIPEVDLYSLLKPRLTELQLPGSVHFKEAGYDLMGADVAKAVLSDLTESRIIE